MGLVPGACAAAWPLVVAHAIGSPEFYWAIVAESSIVLFTALLLVAPRWMPGRLPRFRLVAFGAALLASLLTLIGKLLEVWPGHPLFPSGHTAYAVTMACFLVALNAGWLRLVAPMLVVLLMALVLADYHVPADIVGGAGVGLAVFAAVWRTQRARLARVEPARAGV